MTRTTRSSPTIILMILATAIVVFGCDNHITAPERQEVIRELDVNAFAGATSETADVFGQMVDPNTGELDPENGERELYAEDAATLRRTPNGISLKVQMPTPEPGSYHYGEDTEEGHPEAFTLWVFANGVPFHGGGHIVGGNTLTLSGHISKNTVPFDGSNPLGTTISAADVRITIAPHGAQDPEKLPNQIKTPEATPAHWWVADFE